MHTANSLSQHVAGVVQLAPPWCNSGLYGPQQFTAQTCAKSSVFLYIQNKTATYLTGSLMPTMAIAIRSLSTRSESSKKSAALLGSCAG